MAVAEILLTAFITVLFEKLASSDLISLAQCAGIHSQLIKWSNTLIQIQALLADAGQKHIKDNFVQIWLVDLQHLAYDIDNILDDLATKALRRRLNKESYASTSTSTVRKIIPACFTKFTLRNIAYGYKMGYKLNEITTRLSDLVDRKNFLGLIANVERSIGAHGQVEETSLVDESKIVGRERDKEAVLQKLLGNESCDENVSVVSIVGMGGIGKTTLANLLYNEKKVKDHFEVRAWVCVSDEFDAFNISKAIFKDMGGVDNNLENLNHVQQALIEKLSQKRFLVVLDDVWNDDYKKWEVFQRPFGVGARGSRIMVTTRNTKVATVMDCVQPYDLKVLTNEESLSLFAQNALGKPNFDSHQRFRLLGEGIVKKCDNLPLALMALGRVLRRKQDVKEWVDLLNNEIWKSQDESSILPALRLSYNDLPPPLKQMFAYCSLFPKDYMFEKDELVLLWMAEGFLRPSNERQTMESLGRKSFEELKTRSFFQQSTNAKSQYVMHDLINDLATSVSDEFFFRANEKMGNKDFGKCHHFSFNRHEHRVFKKLKALHRARRLRTFLALQVRADYWTTVHLSDEVLVEFLPHLRFLRVLSLANGIIKEVPQSIGNLKHIRYLNFSNTCITCLPEEVSNLYNLQSLLLRGCYQLSSLPDSFVKLKILRHLDICNTLSLDKIPLGIGGLTNLQTLPKVIIDEADGFKLSELKDLSDLQGQLSIQRLDKVKNATHAKEAKLHQKEGLDYLEMEWSDIVYGSPNEITAYKVLEGLRPHDKLRKLKILFYNGTRFPSWIGDPSFDQLTEFTLRGCKSCTRLPTLGHLGSLRKLFVVGMDGVKTTDFELHGHANSCHGITFPSLEVLEFIDMQSWDTWSANGGDNNGTAKPFPCLREIFIENCPKLAVVSIELIPTLEILSITNCSEVVLRKMVGVSSSIRRLTMKDIEGLTRLDGEVFGHLGALECLSIARCATLVSLGGKDVNLGVCQKSITEMHLDDCKRLESYNCPNSVERLTIEGCPSITSMTFELPSALSYLSLSMPNIPEDVFFNNNFFSSLNDLCLVRWSNLRSPPEGCFAHLTDLRIASCDEIKSIPEKGFGFLPFLCLRSLRIISCKNLKSFPREHLQDLKSLKHIEIFNCPRMDNSFPCGSWPPNLSALRIGGLKKPMSEWGCQNFPTSLVTLDLYGRNSGVVSFAKEEDVMNSYDTTTSSSFLLPPSLTFLSINGFENLESVSEGLQHLTRLQHLFIFSCPEVRDLPETVLGSLSRLMVYDCPKVEERCGDRKGDYWPIISQIPHANVNDS